MNPVTGTEGMGLGALRACPVGVGLVHNVGTEVKVIIRLDNIFR